MFLLLCEMTEKDKQELDKLKKDKNLSPAIKQAISDKQKTVQNNQVVRK